MQSLKSEDIIIKNKNSEMRVLNNGILHNVYFEGTLLKIDDIKDIQEGYNSLPEPKPMKVIQEMQFGVSMSPEARKFAAEHSPDLLGVVYVIKGLVQRLLIRFYVKMWKRDKPSQVFESFDEAFEWINRL